jgi:ribonuclease HI
MEDVGINFDTVAQFSYPGIPVWTVSSAVFVYDMQDLGKKDDTQPDVYISKYRELKSVFCDYTHIYTDGSKDGAAVAAAAVSRNMNRSCRLPDNSSIFSAEAYAILLAVDIIKLTAVNKCAIFCDSLSCLQAIQNKRWDNSIILNILNSVHKLITSGTYVVFIWLPSHVGIQGNTDADTAAKAALALPVSGLEVPHTDYKPLVQLYSLNKWQQSWDLEVHNKLHSIKPQLGKTVFRGSLSRREERILHRLRIGHSHYTHSYLLRDEDQPMCVACQCPLTVEHILVSCIDFSHVRLKYFNASSLCEVFNSVEPKLVLGYIKEIGLFSKI